MTAETLFLSINYLDRFLSIKNVPKALFQLLGVTSVFVAAKYEETELCSLDELAGACNLDPVKVVQMEWMLLDVLVGGAKADNFLIYHAFAYVRALK